MKPVRSAWLALAMIGASLSFPGAAQTTNFPSKPITWIVGYPPGGAADFIARTLSRRMSADLGQPIVVENRAGAAGSIGASAIARAPADGHVIGSSGNGELVFNGLLYSKLPYNPEKDFEPIGPVAKIPFLFAVGSSVPAKNVTEFVALARQKPLQYASGGVGHPNHLSMEMFKSKTGFDIQMVPYKGMAPALQDFLANQVPAMFIDLATATAQMSSGRFRVLAVSTAQRLPALPNVPTMSEAGVPAYDVFAWQALVAPAGTPKPVTARLNDALQKALKDPDVEKAFREAGMIPIVGSPGELTALVNSDKRDWVPLLKSLNLKLD